MMQASPSPDYEARLRSVLQSHDWSALREFARTENQIPDDVYAQDQTFWEVLLYKLICNRIDLFAEHELARAWLAQRGYTSDLGGY